MATIKLRKSDSVGLPANGTLAKGEVAYSYTANAGGNKLYIGTGDAETSPAVAIGGQYYTGLLDHTAGTLTASSGIIVDSDSRINQLIIGDSTNDITITGNTLTLPAGGLTVSGGTITLGSQKITGLAAPTDNTDAATKQYVDGVATGLSVQDDQSTPNSGTIPGSGTFTFLGTQGVTTLFNDANDSLTIGLQQSLDETSNVAFGSATIGSAENKIKIENEVSYELHGSDSEVKINEFTGTPQTLASYSFFMTRLDFLRFAEAMMKDYQNNTCVGNYLRESQLQAKKWYKYRPDKKNAQWWLHNYSKKYGAQFYFDFSGMKNRNIIGTEGLNGQNILIDLDNSRIVVTNSAATGWNVRTFMLKVIKDGKLPK